MALENSKVTSVTPMVRMRFWVAQPVRVGKATVEVGVEKSKAVGAAVPVMDAEVAADTNGDVAVTQTLAESSVVQAVVPCEVHGVATSPTR